MTIRHQKRLTRRAAERALDGAGTSGISHLDELLSAASAPASGFELNREADLVALFRAGHTAVPEATVTRSQAFRLRLAGANTAIAAGVAVLLAGGGFAYAASTGHLPEILGGDHRSETGASNAAQAPGQGEPTDGPTRTPGVQVPAGTPTPSLRGLCRAFQAQADTNPGKAQDNPAFSALARAAGGKSGIATFCVDLIGAPQAEPTSGKPTDKPSGKPSTLPTADGTPSANPTKSANPNKPTPSRAPSSNKNPN
ncbi:MAG: hypothetical protein NTV23_00820 [Propionibacteriales bacterium]|nr:hypothetical protein [Propionibacteriales bacterium]